MMQLIADRILGNPERAQMAIRNCRHTAGRRLPRFKYEGEFRGWLLRVLIDEALALRSEYPQTRQPNCSLEFGILPGV